MFGDRLKQLRLEKGLTQQDLAKLLNASPSTVGMYEQGRRDPDTSTLKFLSDFFNCSVDYLLDETNVKDPVDKIIKKHNDELSTPEFYKSKYKITKKDKEHYEDFIENAHTFFMDDNVAEEDLEKIYKDISELFWEAKKMKKEKNKNN